LLTPRLVDSKSGHKPSNHIKMAVHSIAIDVVRVGTIWTQ